MSEIAHPPVELDILPDNSLEEIFIQEACIMLHDCGVTLEEKSGGQNITTHVTERIEMVSSEHDMTIALRLQSLPVLQTTQPGNEAYVPSDDYAVIALQYALYNDLNEAIYDDEKLNWEPYVLAVINNHDASDLQVLDAKTGLSLDSGDLMTAQVLLTRLRQELRAERFEADYLIGNLAPKFRPISPGPDYIGFEAAEFIDTEICIDVCRQQHASCNHSPYSEN